MGRSKEQGDATVFTSEVAESISLALADMYRISSFRRLAICDDRLTVAPWHGESISVQTSVTNDPGDEK
jgi:hypothetical protein